MDYRHFDALNQSFGIAASRRGLVGAFAGGLAALQAWPLGALDVAAKHRHHKQRKKKQKKSHSQPPLPPPPFNLFGCLDVGQPCRGDTTLCCSGVCQGTAPTTGQPDTSRCVAHNTGACTAEFDGCQTLVIGCGNAGFCFRTTGKASFCGGPGGHCVACVKDADCEAGHGPGAACVVCDDCNGMGGSTGTACYPAAA
jgi:hypothetical protein